MALWVSLLSFSQTRYPFPETYGIVVGVSNYHHMKPLNYADRDAELFTELLRSGAVGAIKPGNLLLLKNDSANAGNFWSGLSRLCNKQLNKGDRVFIYFAGHGDAIKGLNEYYLLLSDCQPANDGNNYHLSLGAIDMYHLKNRIGLLTRQGAEVILVLDACRSNELPGGYAMQAFSINVIDANVGDIAMLATGPGEVSVEHSSFGRGHGIFTYNLVDGFSGLADEEGDGNKDRNISLAELRNWVTRQVSMSSAKFNIKQAPVFCCDDKSNTILGRVDSSFSASWLQYKKMNDGSLQALPGIKINRSGSGQADTALLRLYSQFNESRRQNNLWGTNSADQYYEAMRTRFPVDPVTDDARYVLAADFINFAQQKINLYLEGKDVLSLSSLQEKKDTVDSPSFLQDEYERMKKAASEKWTVTGLMLEKAGRLLSTGSDSSWLLQLKPKIGFLLTRGYLNNEKENQLGFEQALSLLKDSWRADSSMAYMAECMALMYTYRRSLERGLRFLDPGDGSLHFGFGTRHRNDTAFYYFKKAIGMAPNWVSPYRSLALKVYGHYSIDTAKMYMRKAISLNPADVSSYIMMAELIGGKDSSASYYRQALVHASGRGRSEIYCKISSRFYYEVFTNPKASQALTDSALIYGRKAIEANPANGLAYTCVAQAFDKLGNPDSVWHYTREAIRLMPGKGNIYAYRIAVAVYERYKKPDSVLLYSKRLLADDPESGFAASQIGRVYDKRKGSGDSALLYFRRSLELNYDKEYCRERIAYILMGRDKNNTEPLELFTATMQESPFAWRSYYNIACYHGNRGEAERSAASLEKALQQGLKSRKLVMDEPYFYTVKDAAVFKTVLARYFTQ